MLACDKLVSTAPLRPPRRACCSSGRHPEPGLADNGDLEHDLQALLQTAGEAAQKAGTALAIFLDELQYVKEEELAALITALHRTAQRSLPVILIGAGLPQLRGRMGQAKSYAERLFEFPEAARPGASRPADRSRRSVLRFMVA